MKTVKIWESIRAVYPHAILAWVTTGGTVVYLRDAFTPGLMYAG